MNRKDIKRIETLVKENYANRIKLYSEAYEMIINDEQRNFCFGFEQGFIQALIWMEYLIGAELVFTKEEIEDMGEILSKKLADVNYIARAISVDGTNNQKQKQQ